MGSSDEVVIYQFRVVLDGINPLIWRRLIISSDWAITDLHNILQIAFDWDDFHPHQFVIRGKQFGISRAYVNGFADNANEVLLKDFKSDWTKSFSSMINHA